MVSRWRFFPSGQGQGRCQRKQGRAVRDAGVCGGHQRSRPIHRRCGVPRAAGEHRQAQQRASLALPLLQVSATADPRMCAKNAGGIYGVTVSKWFHSAAGWHDCLKEAHLLG